MVDRETFDIAIIGAGPGGYVAAIKATQMGKRVALIEKEYMGGTCLNVGCIPTKTLLANAHILKKIKMADQYGIDTGKIVFHYAKMKARKDEVIQKIRGGLHNLLKANKITILEGHGQFISPTEIKITGKYNGIISADKIIIATGSAPIDVPAFPCDHDRIRNSTSMLELTELPRSMIIVGGGYIGCEFASLFNELEVKITIVEAFSSIIFTQCEELRKALTQSFKKQGIDIKTDTSVEKVDKRSDGVTLHLSNKESLDGDMVLVSVGRRTIVEGLHIEKAGILLDKNGAIEVNEKMETNVPGIYAIGDVTGKVMLAHVASHQGLIAAANACGQEGIMHYRAVPAVIFTCPEIASVGMTLKQAREAGIDASVGKFPFQALGKAVAYMDTEGFAQIVTNRKTGEILGAQMIGHEASTMIAEMALAINNELTLDCIVETIHAHPTNAEAWLEAALLANETPLHFPPTI